MKIIIFKGGLGNQMFEYIYLKYIEQIFPKTKIYGCYPNKGLNRHNGLEINKVFDLDLPPEHPQLKRIFRELHRVSNFLSRFNLVLPFVNVDEGENYKALMHDGFWQNKKYLSNRYRLSFREIELNEKNNEYLNTINESDSVAVHIRRGDYLDASDLYSICSLDYYNKAFSLVKHKLNSPNFIFFSDDPDWVKDNFHEDNTIIVTGNSGKNSFIDMFLMSKCKSIIMANSSFSYWAARINEHCYLTIYPKEWFISDVKSPDIYLDNWIAI